MPFGPKHLPALGLSLLKPLLEAAGFAVDVHYGTLAFAEVIGPDAYERISDSSSDLLLGDWVFADAIRTRDEAAIAEYVDALRRRRRGLRLAKEAVRARALAPAFVARFVDKLLESDPLVVAFTSTFAQNAASLAAAALLKARRPGVKIVFGGANCEGEMGLELLRRFPFIDAAVSGEGESVAVELFKRLTDRAQLAGGTEFPSGPSGRVDLSGLKGVYSQDDPPDRVPETTARIADLDELPIPDFHDFIEAVANLGPGARDLEPHLLVEASRGCWWGEKHHCTFCGLNGSALTFRSKSAERFVEELLFLSEEYRTNGFMAVDNILDHRYLKTALPMLAERGAGINLFFEVKSNLRREQVELLHGSGVRAIQAGIESLDSSVLALMRKGVTGIQNVQLLRLCKEFGIRVSWNMLYGFPGEDPEAYARMAKQLPLLTHLRPPEMAARIRLDRFSPFFEEREALGVRNVRPMPAYEHVYGGSLESRSRLAYYFEFDYADARDVDSYVGPLRAAVDEWRRTHEESDLALIDGGDDLLLVDRRPSARTGMVLLSGLERAVYLACDQIQTIEGAARIVERTHPEARVDEVAALCRRLAGEGLMIEEAGKFLALGVDLSRGGAGRGLRDRFAAAVPAIA